MTAALVPEPYEAENADLLPVVSGPELSDASAEDLSAKAKKNVAHHIVTGTSALAIGVMIERGSGFVANILAARLGGASTFGAYSLAISTANNIATYAGAGIGSTAARFSGKYPFESPGYGTLARVLAFVSFVSAIAAGTGLWLGARPIAALLGHSGQPNLVSLLQWAALSATGIVILECARGFFLGQRRLAALVLMSLIVGVGMLSLLPLAALRHSPIQMIASQGAITTSAVLICLVLARPLLLLSKTKESEAPRFAPVLREVWGFGFVQLAGLAGANAAGWWLVTLIARDDTSLVQMGFFGIASQLRNIVGLAPGLLTEGSFAVMADPGGQLTRTPQRVLGLTTFTSLLTSFVLAATGILIAPWMLRILYSSAYTHAAPTVAFALALAVMHMGNAPASARLSIVSIRSSGMINTVWALFVAALGTLVMTHNGGAATAMLIYFAAHTLSSALVLTKLARKDGLPAGLTRTFVIATSSTFVLACLAAVRADHAASSPLITPVMFVVAACSLAALIALGHHYQWIPPRSAWERLFASSKQSILSLARRRSHVG